MKEKSKFDRLDYVGIASGILLVIFIIITITVGNMTKQAGVANSAVPDDAITLTGTAQGRNGEITVKVVATENTIYQIKVTDNKETKNIGSIAVNQLPQDIYDAQNINVDDVSGATISSQAIKTAINNALSSGGINPELFGGTRVVVNNVANKVETGSKITVMTASQWAETYPEIYESYLKNSENSETTDYVEDYPMIATLYNNYGFSKYYSSARGHFYDITDVTETGRPHALANCFTCKTPDFTAMVNEQGDSAYSLSFEDVQAEINEGISCYNCHANTPGEVTVTHSYLTNGVGEDFDNIDAADLACGQCHVEYYFDPTTKATTLPHDSIDSMSPDAILEYYNNMDVDGENFADYTNPDTGVRQIKVQHPEFETYLGEGSQHRSTYTCADCHMAEETSEDGTTYKSHNLTSPLDNKDLIANECSTCHEDLVSEVKELQADVEDRTNEVGEKLVDLTNKLADAVSSGKYTEEELDEIRAVARNAQFYWDFVFVENSNGAHNPTLTYQCLDKADELTEQALAMIK